MDRIASVICHVYRNQQDREVQVIYIFYHASVALHVFAR